MVILGILFYSLSVGIIDNKTRRWLNICVAFHKTAIIPEKNVAAGCFVTPKIARANEGLSAREADALQRFLPKKLGNKISW